MRRERDKARAILRAGGIPAGRAPSFADVLERSKARTAQTIERRKLSRLTSLAWAATVVLAAAVGWYARQASLQPGVVPTAPETGMQIAIDSPVIEARTPVPLAQQALRRAAERARPPAAAATPAALPQHRADFAKGHASNKQQANAPAPSAELRDAEKQLAGTAPAVGAAQLAKATSIAGWDDVSADVAAQALGGKPLLIADAAVTSYALNASGNHVRITQQIGDGTIIELVESHPRAEGARAEPAPTRSGAAMAPAARGADGLTLTRAEPPDAVSTIRDGYEVSLRVVVTPRGALTRDSLTTLLTRLR